MWDQQRVGGLYNISAMQDAEALGNVYSNVTVLIVFYRVLEIC